MTFAIDKLRSIDIDDFLKKVVKSQFFEKIADKIANKAIEKLKHIKEYEIPSVKRSITNQEDYKSSKYEVRGNDIDTGKSNVNAYEKKEFNETNYIENVQAQVAIEKETSSEQIKLKYKHFTRNIDEIRSLEKRSTKFDNNFDADEKYQPKSDESREKSHHRASTVKDESKSVENNKRARPEKSENKNDNKELKRAVYSSKETIEKSKENTENISDAAEEDNISQRDISSDHKASMKYISNLSDNSGRKSAETDKSGQDTKNIDNIKASYEELQPKVIYKNISEVGTFEYKTRTNDDAKPIETTMTDDIIQSSNKLSLVRKEGNNLYTYQKLPEYDEYVQELNRVNKFETTTDTNEFLEVHND